MYFEKHFVITDLCRSGAAGSPRLTAGASSGGWSSRSSATGTPEPARSTSTPRRPFLDWRWGKKKWKKTSKIIILIFLDCRGTFYQQRGNLRRDHREGEAGERGGPRGSPSARGPGPRVERGQSQRPEPRRGQGHHRRLEAGALHRAPRVQGGRGVTKVGAWDQRPRHGPLLRWQVPLRKDVIRMMMIVMIIRWRDNCITVPLVADALCSLH